VLGIAAGWNGIKREQATPFQQVPVLLDTCSNAFLFHKVQAEQSRRPVRHQIAECGLYEEAFIYGTAELGGVPAAVNSPIKGNHKRRNRYYPLSPEDERGMLEDYILPGSHPYFGRANKVIRPKLIARGRFHVVSENRLVATAVYVPGMEV